MTVSPHRALTGAACCICLALAGLEAGSPARLRLNEMTGLVHDPAQSQGYGMTMAGTDLYVSWLGRQAFGVQVQLSRVDLNDFAIRETLQLSEGKGASSKGGRRFPDVLEFQGGIYASWLDKGQRERQAFYSVNFLSLSEFRKGGKPQVLEFGKFAGDPRLVKTSQGLFLLGYSQNLGERDWRLRLFKKSDKGWIAIQQLNQDLFKGRNPHLIDDSQGISLLWVWGGKIFRARSGNGVQWSKPQAVVEQEKRIDSLQVNSAAAKVDLAWVEHGWDQAKVWVDRFNGSSWVGPQAVAQLNGKNVAISVCRDKNSEHRVIAYSYTGLEGAGRVIGVVSEREGWAAYDLTAQQPRFAGSPVPLLYEGADGLYVAWSFHPRTMQVPRAESLFLAELGAMDIGEVQPRPIGLRETLSVDSAPKLWQFRDELYVSFFSSRFTPGGAVLARGDLYLEKVELLREARGE